MASIPLKPGYGPTLGQLLSPLWRRTPLLGRMAVILLLALLVLLAVGLWLHLRGSQFSHSGTVSFSFSYKGMRSVPPEAGAFVKLVRDASSGLEDSFSVSPLQLPPYRGHLAGELPIYAIAYTARLRSHSKDFVLRGEGETKVNEDPAYNIFYTLTRHGQELYGRDVLLFPRDPHPRRGARLSMLTPPGLSSEVTSPLLVGGSGTLERPLHSFTF